MPNFLELRTDTLTASALINLFSLALPITVLQVYDRVIPNQASATLFWLIIGLATALAMDMTMRITRSYLMGRAAAKFEHTLGCKAVRRLLTADINSIEKDAGGTHAERLNAIDAMKDFYSNQGPAILVDLPFAILSLSLILAIGGPLILAPIMMIAGIGAIAAFLGLKLRELLRQKAVLDERRFNFIVEVLSGIHTVKSYTMERLMLRRSIIAARSMAI